jgi:hypothetical protein
VISTGTLLPTGTLLSHGTTNGTASSNVTALSNETVAEETELVTADGKVATEIGQCNEKDCPGIILSIRPSAREPFIITAVHIIEIMILR